MKQKTFDIKILFYLILLIPFFRITYFVSEFPMIQFLYNILQVFAVVVIIFLVLKKGKYSKIINYIFLFCISLIVSTICSDGDIIESIQLMIKVVFLSLLIDYGLKNDTKSFLNSFEFFMSFLVYINFICILLFPNGMYMNAIGYTENWLLGYKNLHIVFILPAIFLTFTNSYYTYNKSSFRNYMLLIISIISLYLANSSTSIVGIIFILIFVIFEKIFDNYKIFNIINYFKLNIILFFSIIVFKIQRIFKFFIVDMLHKDLTFTGRTYIWDYVLKLIEKRKIIGYGLEDSNFRLSKSTIWQSYHAHDQFLEITYKGGIVGLIIYIMILLKSFKKVYSLRMYKISKFISIVIFSYLIMMLTEFYAFDTYMYIFIFCYNIDCLIKGGQYDARKN